MLAKNEIGNFAELATVVHELEEISRPTMRPLCIPFNEAPDLD